MELSNSAKYTVNEREFRNVSGETLNIFRSATEEYDLIPLANNQLSYLMRRLPDFELSYETISHNKVSELYDICTAIPIGKKCCAWFTFHEKKHVCYLFELNREKKFTKATIVPTTFHDSLALGTIVYGTIWQEFFVVEDILHFEGISMKLVPCGERLGFLQQFMEKQIRDGAKLNLMFALSVMWKTSTAIAHDSIPANIVKTIAFPVHHIQYRSLTEIMPYLNVSIQRKILTTVQSKESQFRKDVIDYSKRIDLSKPQYKYPTIFQVSADPQFDIYHLYAYGKNNQIVYYNVAYVPTYKTSVFMNGLFRKIRENRNLDYIEESDDDDDFQDMNESKYVDTTKVLLMECVFNSKFKKWTPLRVVDKRSKVIHIYKLTS